MHRTRRESSALLELGLQSSGSTLWNIDVELHLLALADERVPGHHFVLTGRHILDLERPVFLHHGKVRAGDREKERLHELMLIALQPIEPVFFRAATEYNRLIELIALLGQTDVETGRRARALDDKAMRIVEDALSRLGIIRIGVMVLDFE